MGLDGGEWAREKGGCCERKGKGSAVRRARTLLKISAPRVEALLSNLAFWGVLFCTARSKVTTALALPLC